MQRKVVLWTATLVASLVALSGGGLAAPALSVAPTEGPIGTPVAVTGSGFTPDQQVGIEWETMIGNRVSGSGFNAVSWPVGSAQADASGNLHFEFRTPSDLGGPPHAITAVDGETFLAEAQFTITRTAQITPTSGPLGTIIELHMTGGGWTEYDNIVAVTYDNAYIGYMCSFNTQGNMTTWFPASGGVGLHSVDVWPALYTGPSDGPMPWKLPHLSTGDVPEVLPIFHFEFTITDMNGSLPQQAATVPPPAVSDGLGAPLLAGAAVAFLAAAALELPIRRSGRRSRVPVAAASALMLFSLLAIAGGPGAASEGSPDPPTIVFLSASGEPQLGLSAGTANPGSPLTLTGAGLPPSATLDIQWGTAEVKSKVALEKFKGWNVTLANWSLGSVATSATGAFTQTISTPFDYGGIHPVRLLKDGAVVASSAVIIVPYFEIVGPTHVKAGEKVTVSGFGLGYEKYSGAWNVAYDNRLTGWVSGIESHGNVTFSLTAVGAPGQHFIDIGEGAVGFPYLNLWESPFQNRPPAHLDFVIDGAGGPAVLPGPAPAIGIELAAFALAGGAIAVAVQGIRWWSSAGRAAGPKGG